jgi:hypothetical protein
MDKTLKTGGSIASGLASIALPGRKLATSKTPRMLKPFEIALLRQDLRAALTVIGQDEIDDARQLLVSCGYRVGEFEFTQQAGPPPQGVAPISGTVTCSRRATRATRSYVAGHQAPWLKQFEDDLRADAFGPRSVSAASRPDSV